MSHSEERKEKKCLNCNAVVHGRYCGICGQENLQPQESFWHLVSHFFNDITHFDGKFFSSLKWLILKPGFLPQEYVSGRRASYLNPIRMYLFTSAIFFLIYFSFFSTAKPIHVPAPAQSALDSAKLAGPVSGSDTSKSKKASRKGLVISGNSLIDNNYRDRKQYDSLLRSGAVDDNFFVRLWRHKQFSMQERYGHDDNLIKDQIMENFRHNIPGMFFLSLPLFALFLKLLYIRRKQFYYVAHLIFTLHLYIFVYIAVLILLSLGGLAGLPHMGWLWYPVAFLWLLVVYYAYKAMRNFYDQRRGKTILKFLLLSACLVFALLILIAGGMLFSIFKL